MVDSLTVRCLYCGGPQTAEHPTCPVCGAFGHFVTCGTCRAKMPAGYETCRCGAVLDPKARMSASPPCPRCGHELALRRLSDGESSALQCEACHGAFVRVRDWTLMVDDSRSGHPIDTTPFVVPDASVLAPDVLVATVRCPACHRDMDRFHFGLNSPAVVDVCDNHGIWLDGGELARVLGVAAEVATTGRLPAESEADVRADAALGSRLAKEEREVNRNAEVARANFRTDPAYRLAERWGSALSRFSDLAGTRGR